MVGIVSFGSADAHYKSGSSSELETTPVSSFLLCPLDELHDIAQDSWSLRQNATDELRTEHALPGEKRLPRVSTLDLIDGGWYTLNGRTFDLRVSTEQSKRQTTYYAPDSLLSSWSSSPAAKISLLKVSTLEGAQYLHEVLRRARAHAHDVPGQPAPKAKVGVLNFASARKPGGGFKSGAQAQEESIARSSTLYPTLMTRVAQAFYTLHNRDQKGGYYTAHAMIYSPGVTVFRADNGDLVEPYQIDVLTSPAVNAGVVRQTLFGRVASTWVEDKIKQEMRERLSMSSLLSWDGIPSTRSKASSIVVESPVHDQLVYQ